MPPQKPPTGHNGDESVEGRRGHHERKLLDKSQKRWYERPCEPQCSFGRPSAFMRLAVIIHGPNRPDDSFLPTPRSRNATKKVRKSKLEVIEQSLGRGKADVGLVVQIAKIVFCNPLRVVLGRKVRFAALMRIWVIASLGTVSVYDRTLIRRSGVVGEAEPTYPHKKIFAFSQFSAVTPPVLVVCRGCGAACANAFRPGVGLGGVRGVPAPALAK